MKKERGTLRRRSAFLAVCLTAGLLTLQVQAEEPAQNDTVQTQAGETGETKSRTQEADVSSGIRLTIGGGQTTPSYKAGQTGIRLEIKVENQGGRDAAQVRIAPVIENVSDWPFEITEWDYEKDLGDIPAGRSVSAVYENLKIRQDVEGKTYGMKFRVTCMDQQQETAVEKTVYVKTAAAEKKADPSAESSRPEENPAPAGVGNGSAESAVYNGEPVSVSGTSAASVPRVIVTGFDTEPGEVQAGSDFKLIIHVKNTSKKTAVSNMLFDLQAPAAGTEAAAEAPAFLPASGGSSIYLEKIPAGATKDISIQLNARADLLQKPYSIDLSMKYEDGSAAQYESSSSLAIPVKQAARFEFSEPEISPDSIEVGEEANLTCSLYNTGRTKLYNVKVRFEGEGIDAQEVFVGNVESGATGIIDAMLTGEAERSMADALKMIVSYEDESGKTDAAEEEIHMEVLPAAEMEEEAVTEETTQEQGFPVVLILLALLLLLAAAILFFVRRRKKKRAEEFDDGFADGFDDGFDDGSEDESGSGSADGYDGEEADEVDRFTEDE